MVKNPPASAGHTRDSGLSPELGRSPEVGNGKLLQYPGLENSTDREAGGLQFTGPQSQRCLSMHK